MGVFANIGAYYDALANSPGRLEREGRMLLRSLQNAPGNRVLDLACGTGLHAQFFAGHGAQVTAIDRSESMIAWARTHRAHPSIRYAVGDMRAPEGGPYDLVVCLGNALALLDSPEDRDRMFRRVAGALAPRGRFLVQMVNYAASGSGEPAQRVARMEVDGANVVAVKNLVPEGSRTLLALVFFVAHAPGEYTTHSDTAVLRHWSEGDLMHAAEQAGLARSWAVGDFGGVPYEEAGASDLIICFSKV
ncbi:MAG: class I SAM-dependent methyltransferase [Candidatus Hydrogenedentota bacterium]